MLKQTLELIEMNSTELQKSDDHMWYHLVLIL